VFQQKEAHLLREGKEVIIFTAACTLTVLEVDHHCRKYKRSSLVRSPLAFLFVSQIEEN